MWIRGYWKWAYFGIFIDVVLAWSLSSVADQPLGAGNGTTNPGLETRWTERPEDWPGFRGRYRSGVVQAGGIRTDWSANPPRALWRKPIGPGWSSLAVVGGMAFTMEQRSEAEYVVALDAATGREIWAHSNPASFHEPFGGGGGNGPRATPTFDEGKIFALGATGMLDCLDARTGRVIWSRNILQDAATANVDYGMAASPLVYEGLVICNPGGPNGRGLIAYNKNTGEPIWAGGSSKAGYSSPTLAMLKQTLTVLIFDGDGAGAYDAQTGKELWRFPFSHDMTENCVQPIAFGDSYVLVSKHYATVLLEVAKNAPRWSVQPRWESRDLRPKFTDLVAKDQYVYGFNGDAGILTCLDVATGQRVWRGGRFGRGQLLLVGNYFIAQSDRGEIALVEATPNGYSELGRFQGLDGTTWTPPALVNGRLFVRNATEVACYDVSK